MRTKSSGFTLVEVLIISPIIILFVGTFIALLVNLTGESLVIRERNVAIHDSQAALDDLQASITQATGFLTATGALPSPQGKNNLVAEFTDTTSGEPDTLIMKLAATNKSPNDSTRSLIYTGAGTCDSKNPIYTYYAIYFVALDTDTADPADKALFKRTILPQVSACAVPWQRPSCAAAVKASNPTVCKRNDEKLVGGIASMDVKYYTGNSAARDNDAPTATDVSVNLSVSKQIAGSTVDYASSVRATSLNVQSAEAGALTASTTPNPPVTWSRDTTNPYNTTVTWNSVGNATSYTVKYRINGGSEQITTINQSPTPPATYSTTLVATFRKQTVQLVDIVVNTNTGAFSYGAMPAISAIPRWNDCSALLGGWQNYGAPYNDAGFTRTMSGAVGLKGLVRYGSVGSPVCDLPDEFAPDFHLIFPVLAADPVTGTQSYGRLDISPTGVVTINATPSSGNGWVSLDGIIYMPKASNPPWTNGGLISPWYYESYSGTHSQPKYYQDTRGRAWVQGLASGGQPNYRLFWMSGVMAPQYGAMHIVAASVDRGSAVNINPSPDIVGRPSSGAWVSTQFLYYSTGGLYDMYLYNGWANYNNGWSLAKCYRGDDDITILQGLVNAGNTAGVEVAGIHNCGGVYGIPTMSTGRNAILPGRCNWERACRLDLSPNNYLYGYSVDAGWTSFDGIHFIAD